VTGDAKRVKLVMGRALMFSALDAEHRH